MQGIPAAGPAQFSSEGRFYRTKSAHGHFWRTCEPPSSRTFVLSGMPSTGGQRAAIDVSTVSSTGHTNGFTTRSGAMAVRAGSPSCLAGLGTYLFSMI